MICANDNQNETKLDDDDDDDHGHDGDEDQEAEENEDCSLQLMMMTGFVVKDESEYWMTGQKMEEAEEEDEKVWQNNRCLQQRRLELPEWESQTNTTIVCYDQKETDLNNVVREYKQWQRKEEQERRKTTRSCQKKNNQKRRNKATIMISGKRMMMTMILMKSEWRGMHMRKRTMKMKMKTTKKRE